MLFRRAATSSWPAPARSAASLNCSVRATAGLTTLAVRLCLTQAYAIERVQAMTPDRRLTFMTRSHSSSSIDSGGSCLNTPTVTTSASNPPRVLAADANASFTLARTDASQAIGRSLHALTLARQFPCEECG
jgi:hypothetical protein